MSDKQFRINYDRLESAFPRAYFEFASGVAEPGYEDKPVILANWNYVPGKMFDALENHGFACEWSDEWMTCPGCDKIVRTSPDSYGWNPSYVEIDSEYVCLDCAESEIDDYYESLENVPTKCVTEPVARRYPLEDSGYIQIESGYESGFHPHQTADPKSILARLLESDPLGRFIFVLTDTGQFDIEFAVYKRERN